MAKVSSVPLASIRTDGGTQMRAELTQDVYLDYRDKWRAGVEFDPLDVFFDGVSYWLADGFHRFYGAREAKRKDVPCRVRQGTQRDAILFAVGANDSHGLRRTNADKRKAVEALLSDEEWCKWSDRMISDKAAVSQPFVSELRKQLITVISSTDSHETNGENRVGRDGKRRKVKRKKKPLPPVIVSPPVESDEADYEPVADEQNPSTPAQVEGVVNEFKKLWARCNVSQKVTIRAMVLSEEL